MRSERLAAVLCAAMAMLAPAATAAPSAHGCLTVINVEAWDFLYIRSKPDHRSEAVGAIAPDHTGEIVLEAPCKPQGASRRRQWCPVTYFPLANVRREGFVKAYFVEPLACRGG